ncbi:MAG: DUF4397 domain-containing protein [Fimbriimonadaceae bacterium]|nr:DUF4397 domain-containing protein [Fimbriimonadaceae bacterium]
MSVFAVMAMGALAGCGGDGDHPLPTANVRVIHASPDAPNVDVLFNNRTVLSDVPYFAGAVVNTTAGPTRVRVNAAGSTTTVIDANVSFTTGTLTSVIAAGTLATISPIVINDPDAGPGAANARVRIVHASPTAGVVDVYVTAPGAPLPAEPTLADVPFRTVSDALTVPAGNYQVRVTPANTPGTVAIDTGTINLPANSVSLALALDADGGGAPLTARLFTKTY